MDTTKKGKIVVISAPSGCGKSTIINSIIDRGDIPLNFSVSATNRAPREGETNGVHYHFLSTSEFLRKVSNDEFVEWEEVYPGRYYGTLKDEIRRSVDRGENVILDIDVKGAQTVKKLFGHQALTIFIMPPSVDELRRRLEARQTDSPEVIDQRVGKAAEEIGYADTFDCRVVNDNLPTAVDDTRQIILNFLNS